MKKSISILFIALCSIILLQCVSNSYQSFSLLSEKVQKTIVIELSTALNDMAQASRPIGNDSETYWAASVIDSLHNNVMTNNCSFLEQVSTIHHMNSYFAYGMNYFPSVIGMYSCPEEANYARYSVSVCDSLTNNIKSTEFKDIMAIADLSCHSYFYTQLYVTMFYKINGYEDFEDKDLGFPLQNLGLLRYANERCVFSEEELIKIYFVFDAVCFYKTFYNYLMSLTYDDIQRNKTHDKLIDYAYYIDEISGPIFDTVYANEYMPLNMTNIEFEEFMLKTTEIKVVMMRLLKEQFVQMSNS